MNDDEIEKQTDSSNASELDNSSAPDSEAARSDAEKGDDTQGKTLASDESRALEEAFRLGNFADVRRLSDELLSRSDLSAELVEIAKDYRRRVGIDPVQLMILAGSLIFFAFVVYIYVL